MPMNIKLSHYELYFPYALMIVIADCLSCPAFVS
jgi:hypothetical protein